MTSITHVIKRTGRLVLFDENKVTSAVWKAMQAEGSGTKEDAEAVMRLVVQKLDEEFSPDNPPTVEDVQDRVEQSLMALQHVKVAKAYILYRHERSKLREEKRLLTGGKLDDLDLPLNGLRVLEQRYLARDEQGSVIETPSELFWRVADRTASAEQKYGGDPKAARRVFYRMLCNLEFLPASPILMNAGTPKQLSSNVVLPIEDDLQSVFKTLADAALVQKNGGGTGFSFSRLRPKNDAVGGITNVTGGPVAFMRIYEAAMRAIKQGGRRRGANMGVLRVDHPDILDFINLKLDGQTLTNFNISVALTDGFMRALESDGEYDLINPRTGQAASRLSARVVFDTILASSWRAGDPGILFIDRINAANPCKHIGSIEATGPCGEQPLMPYESCNEGSINLMRCVKARKLAGTVTKEVDWEKIRRITREAVRFLDNTIDINNYVMPELERMAKGTRKIGLGIMGFADLLYDLRIPYDSEEAAQTGERIAQTIAEEADDASKQLAQERGPFAFYPGSELEHVGLRRRNATLLGIAPTGTISMIADVSGGIEPNFALAFTRTVTDGRDLVCINPVFEEAMRDAGIADDVVRKVVQRGTADGIEEIPESLRKVFVTSQQIAPEWHIRIQAAFQRHIDGAISKTINYQSGASIRDIGEGLLLAWNSGCKGLTVYRDGSLPTQVITFGSGSGGGQP